MAWAARLAISFCLTWWLRALIGVLGLMAVGGRDGFRTAAIIATTILGFGATLVHLQDIVAHGNLAPGNTIQNISNLLDPILLIGLSWWSARRFGAEMNTAVFQQWQMRQQPIPGLAAAGIGMGFGLGYAAGGLFVWTLIGALAGVGIGLVMSRRVEQATSGLVLEQQ